MGIQTVEKLLTKILKNNSYNVYATKEVMSRVRGGNNSTEIRVGQSKVRGYKHHVDIFVPINKNAIERHVDRFTENTMVIGEKDNMDYDFGSNRKYEIAFSDIAKEIGNKLYTNTVAVGTLCGVFDVDKDKAADFVFETFKRKGEKVAQENKQAFLKGYEESEKIEFESVPKSSSDLSQNLLINGADAVALGGINAGADFVSSYPMSPSTTVLIAFAQRAKKFGLVVEQAEDEIAAINMACGASFAGARPFVTTSGGGLALMSEGISLAGITETPVVIHIAQRPGPATGLPTRTEQGDLNLALYSGHGDFPRAIFAPVTIESAFKLSGYTIEMADEFQTPIFLLTDQYFVDSYYNIKPFEISADEPKKRISKSDENYKRYTLTDSGISERAIPGHGTGVVKVDSDEHDEHGHITESFEVRKDMVHKRLQKLQALEKKVIQPIQYNTENAKVLLIGWGSTYQTIKEAVEEIDNPDIALMHFEQVYPLPEKIEMTLESYDQVIFIENNVTGQFAELIRKETGFNQFKQILKYDGIQFSVEQLTEEINKIMEEV
jgi:2-oxoglutarate ferredoxin oxidoreductase subunit alpha